MGWSVMVFLRRFPRKLPIGLALRPERRASHPPPGDPSSSSGRPSVQTRCEPRIGVDDEGKASKAGKEP
jgi:hypothetical protein